MTATVERKAENADYKDIMVSDTAAKELLKWAKNRLNKFYNPALYVPAPKVEAAPGGTSGTGIAVLVQTSEHKHGERAQDAPPAPPETWDAYSKRHAESTG